MSGLSLICKDHPRNTQPDPAKDTCYFCGLPLPARVKDSYVVEAVFEDEQTKTLARRERQKRKTSINSDFVLFTMSHDIIAGQPCTFTIVSQPFVTMIPRRMFSNAFVPSMFLAKSAILANCNQIVGIGWLDCHMAYSRAGIMLTRKLRMSPANRVTFDINYTGFLVDPMVLGMPFTFCIALRGPTDCP